MSNKTSCPGKPEELKNLPIGMYHCEYCGAMVIAGLPHPTDEQVREADDIPYGDQVCRLTYCVVTNLKQTPSIPCRYAIVDKDGNPDCGYG